MTDLSQLAQSGSLKFQDALLEMNLLTPQQVELLRVESINSGRSIAEIARDMGLLTDEDVTKIEGRVMNLPYVDLRASHIEKEVLGKLPEQMAKNYQLAPFEQVNENRYKVAVVDPKNIQALEALEFLSKKSGFRVDLYITSKDSMKSATDQYGNLTSEVGRVLTDATEELGGEKIEDQVETAGQLEKIVSEAPIAKAVSAILKYAVKNNVSDIHLEPTETELRVRYRVDGVLINSLNLPRRAINALISRVKILSNLKIDESRVPQDGRIKGTIDGKEIDFRVSTFPTVNGEKVVMRILDATAGIKTLEDIGITGRGFDKLVEGLAKPYGLTVVTGPTGSGKSTTLYASMSRLNQIGVNIVTLEDPVEYHMEGVNQSQINPKIGYTFAAGLRSILRQDPDIVMVGEIRDEETAEMAVHASLTGHIVLSTLHTNDAAGALPRLVDMGIEPFLMVSAVNTIVAQRLVRRICSACKAPTTLTPPELKAAQDIIDDMPDQVKHELKPLKDYTFMKGAGCDICNKTGYKGRQGIFEVLPLSEAVADVLLKRGSGTQIKEQAVKEGMVTMQQDGVLKVLNGITTFSEVVVRTKE